MRTAVNEMTHLSRPKMKAFSLMLWLVSSEYWLTFENRLWRTRVDGPERTHVSKNTLSLNNICKRMNVAVCECTTNSEESTTS